MLDALASPDAFTLRSDVVMPAWSFIADPTARKALAASMVAAGRAQKLSGLSAAEDRVWQAIPLAFACSDKHPTPSDKVANLDGARLRLSMNAAMQVGKALFVPMLAGLPSQAGEGKS